MCYTYTHTTLERESMRFQYGCSREAWSRALGESNMHPCCFPLKNIHFNIDKDTYLNIMRHYVIKVAQYKRNVHTYHKVHKH